MEFIKKIKYYILIFALGFAACFFGIRQKTKIVTEYKEKIVTKEVKVESEKKQEKKDTYKKIVEKPDGEIVTIIREIVDNKKENNAQINNESETNKEYLHIEEKSSSSFGIMTRMSTTYPFFDDYGISMKYTISDPFSINSVYMIKSKDLLIGISFDF